MRLSAKIFSTATSPSSRSIQDVAKMQKSQLSSTREDAAKVVLRYHNETKHAPKRYARSMGHLDWANQPNPFRSFAGTERIELLAHLPSSQPRLPFYGLDAAATRTADVTLSSLSDFLYHSMALSAWKEYGTSKWSLRVNPSSGNLHPTECYLILPSLKGLASGGVFHYASKFHHLERRCTFGETTFDELDTSSKPLFYVALSSVLWREVWKYGERAYRYCQHDVGHALAALEYSAALQGWRLELMSNVSDRALGRLIGLDRREDFNVPEEEAEVPDLLCAVHMRTGAAKPPPALNIAAIGKNCAWVGSANVLSPAHHEWPIIKQVHDACERGDASLSEKVSASTGSALATFVPSSSLATFAAKIIRQRRSAVDMDGTTSISKHTFFRILSQTVPSLTSLPWASVSARWRPEIHLGLFVHRVQGLAPGLYFLARNSTQVDALKQDFVGLPKKFLWEKVVDRDLPIVEQLPLYRLSPETDVKREAALVSCTQEIAGDGCFAVSMFGRFRDVVEADPSNYRRLHWESGMVGQVLYLEAEAAGVRGTGIGCFFDDLVTSVFGVTANRYQALYNFTIGGPVEDERLRTLEAYQSHGKY